MGEGDVQRVTSEYKGEDPKDCRMGRTYSDAGPST